MNRIILTVIVYAGFFSCSSNNSETSDQAIVKGDMSISSIQPDSNFFLIEDFEKNTNIFRKDTFELYGLSADGGRLVAFHSKDKDYLVLDIWLFGETGKIHSTYWTDRRLNFRIVKRTDYAYDKPYYEGSYKVEERTAFYSYLNESFKIYNADKRELTQSDTVESENKVRSFFTDVTKGIEILK